MRILPEAVLLCQTTLNLHNARLGLSSNAAQTKKKGMYTHAGTLCAGSAFMCACPGSVLCHGGFEQSYNNYAMMLGWAFE